MDVAEFEIMSNGATIRLIVLGLAPWIIALIVTVIHPISSQRFKESNNSALQATALVREALNSAVTDCVSVVIAKQDRKIDVQPIVCLDDDEVGHNLNFALLVPSNQP